MSGSADWPPKSPCSSHRGKGGKAGTSDGTQLSVVLAWGSLTGFKHKHGPPRDSWWYKRLCWWHFANESHPIMKVNCRMPQRHFGLYIIHVDVFDAVTDIAPKQHRTMMACSHMPILHTDTHIQEIFQWHASIEGTAYGFRLSVIFPS